MRNTLSTEVLDNPPASLQAWTIRGFNDAVEGKQFPKDYEGADKDEQLSYEFGRMQAMALRTCGFQTLRVLPSETALTGRYPRDIGIALYHAESFVNDCFPH